MPLPNLGLAVQTFGTLQGLSQDRERQEMLKADRLAAQQSADALAGQQQALQDLMSQYAQTNDPAILREIIVKSPDAAQKIQKQFGIIDQQTANTKLNHAATLKQMIETNPQEAAMYWQQNLASDPAFDRLADNFQSGDMTGALDDIGFTVTGIGGQEAYDSLFGGSVEGKIGTYNPRDFTVESLSNFIKGGQRDPSVLERVPVKPVMINDVPYLPDADGSYRPVSVKSGSGGDVTSTELTPEVISEQAATAAADLKTAETKATETERRNATIIDEGLAQARTIPTLKQTISLLERVKTGGWTNQTRNWVKQKFGVEDADEGVLTANLGKAVLSQLRTTFGAAFTEREGARLEAIEAGFGKSPETNKVLLKQLLQMAQKDVDSAMARADDQVKEELQGWVDFEFDLGAETPEQGQEIEYQEGQTATGPNGAKMIFQSGGWVAQ